MSVSREPCFVASECFTSYCPNIQCDRFEEVFNFPASDAGFSRIPCSWCHFNTGLCEDCLFHNTDLCFKFGG